MPSIRSFSPEYFDLVPKTPGRYSSFPSLCRDPKTEEVLILYRQACYDEADERAGMLAHGLDGNLYVCKLDPATLDWTGPSLVLSAEDYPPNLIDGFLTGIDHRLHMIFRRFPHDDTAYHVAGNSLSDIMETGKPRLFPSRQQFPEGPSSAQWGKIVQAENGALLQAFYGCPDESPPLDLDAPDELPPTRVAVYQSVDSGETWNFLSWITPLFVANGISANETALLRVGSRIYAAMRTQGEYPCPMYLNWSDDNGHTWSAPQPTGLSGEAPAWLQLPDGRVLLGYRGYCPEDPEEGGTVAIAEFNPKTQDFSNETVIDTYLGNHYDGGYCDLIWLNERGQLLVAYYYCDTPEVRNPWIRCAVLTLPNDGTE